MVTLPILPRFQTTPEVRPLPSTGITRFQRYYEPVRHRKGGIVNAKPRMNAKGNQLVSLIRHTLRNRPT